LEKTKQMNKMRGMRMEGKIAKIEVVMSSI
jgi:hypothetical protein